MLPYSDVTIDLAIARRRMLEREQRAATYRAVTCGQRTFVARNVRAMREGGCWGPGVA